jgi:hypothetical protein
VKISWGLNVFARFQSDGYEDVRFPTSPYQFSVQLLKYTGRENDKGLEENAPVQGPAVPPASHIIHQRRGEIIGAVSVA